MGGKISVIGKTNNHSNENRFIELYNSRKLYNLSYSFMYLMDSQYYDISPFNQIQNKLKIDLLLFTSVPEIVFSTKIYEIENELSDAKYKKKIDTITDLELRLRLEKERVKREAEETLTGWTLIKELIELTELLLSKFMKYEDLANDVEDPFDGFRDDYFSKKKTDTFI